MFLGILIDLLIVLCYFYTYYIEFDFILLSCIYVVYCDHRLHISTHRVSTYIGECTSIMQPVEITLDEACYRTRVCVPCRI